MTNDELEAVKENWLARFNRLKAKKDWAGALAMLRASPEAEARATRAEAHAERLASIIARGLAMEQAPPYANDMEARRTALRKEARQVLSAYRGEMK